MRLIARVRVIFNTKAGIVVRLTIGVRTRVSSSLNFGINIQVRAMDTDNARASVKSMISIRLSSRY